MSSSSYITIATYGRHETLQVPLPKSGKLKELLQTLGKQLGLKPTSIQCFALYRGSIDAPEYKIVPSDDILKYNHLCLLRHGLDLRKEHKLLSTDDVAVNLLFSEALANYKRNDKLTLKPTEEQKYQLEEYLDPHFISERQFLETVHQVQGYTSMRFEGVVGGKSNIENNACVIPVGTAVGCICTEEQLQLSGSNGVEINWDWKTIRRWRLSAENTATFEVTNTKGNAGIMEYIYITSNQAPLLLQTARFFCTELVYKANPSKRPIELPDGPIVGKAVDPLYEFMNQALFGSGPKFTTIK